MRVVEGWMRNYVGLLKQGVPDIEAARRAGVGIDRVVEKKRRDPEFADEVEAATSSRK